MVRRVTYMRALEALTPRVTERDAASGSVEIGAYEYESRK